MNQTNDPLLTSIIRWKISPEHAIFVGDSKDDMVCGKNSGVLTCLLRNDHNRDAESLADLIIDTLIDLIPQAKTIVINQGAS
jgi:phosphoglycolate phosphatase-like HAD superfamily hydrolase